LGRQQRAKQRRKEGQSGNRQKTVLKESTAKKMAGLLWSFGRLPPLSEENMAQAKP